MVEVSIIIVNYNTYQLVVDCIRSVYEKTKDTKFEIIVVDNLSPNREIEELNLLFPDVKLVLNNKNAGFGAANNIGAKHALGKYLFLLNSDTILINDAISILTINFEKLPKAGVVGANLYSEDLKAIGSYENTFPGLMSDINLLFNDLIFKLKYRNYLRFNKTLEIKKIGGYIYGADFFIRKDIFEKSGTFDEDFFMYSEETELSKRIKNLGYEFYSIPEAKIIHLEGGSQEGFSDLKISWLFESKKLYYRKTRTSFYKISQYLLYLSMLRSLFFGLITDNKSKKEVCIKFLNFIKKDLFKKTI
ncbi:hypothetical protein SAMN05443634_108180 [Chishuiella changwenlii]|uniref:Glycosyl transferase n=1 Tax=Chishuiella changwenlii TaxID=1434701 RepID=A0A1M7A5I3_9FLAO|nr:glycosyltransferase family 2 protein [Chishuiella changwenlii]GGF10257.1 glycosyl transferase [Chishuiella changwenlii]SHL38001.1 hypothetical protein SAMN05443634_108180 [Chishuiella changwenlii]